MRTSPRSARPVRLTLANVLGGDIDGAWWPHTASGAGELASLVDALHRPLGEILDININWSPTEAAPDLSSLRYGARPLPTLHCRPQRLMIVAGRLARAKLLVIPHMTSAELGLMVLRRAAATPISDAQRDSEAFRNADRVVRAAEVESAMWGKQALEPQA
jgi:hypothetical protein